MSNSLNPSKEGSIGESIGFRVKGLRVQGLGFRVCGLECGDRRLTSRDLVFIFRDLGLETSALQA